MTLFVHHTSGRGYVVTGTGTSLGNIGTTLPWTSTRTNQNQEFETFVVTPIFGQATQRPEENTARFVPGSGQGATTPISDEELTTKTIEETPRFFPAAPNDGTGTNQQPD